MNVLLLTQVLPYPPDSGPKIKTYNVLKYLAWGHEVTLVSFVRGDQADEVAHLRRYCRAIHTVPMRRGVWRDLWYMGRSFLSGQPFIMLRDQRAAMHHLIARLAAETHFEVAHADQLNMAQYAARVPGPFKILDAHNALWMLYKRLGETMPAGPRRWIFEREWKLLKEYEGRICRQFDAVLAVSDEDRATLEEAAGQRLDVQVIPIAIDTDEARPVARRPQARHILHIGTMYWPPNVDAVLWFAREVFPLIRAQRPGVQFDVVGKDPPPEIVALDGNGMGINVAGYVADPTSYFQRAALVVVPVRAGSGMRVKILQNWARGIPIVSTTLGCEGIEVRPGKDILVADEAATFAAEVLRLLSDEQRAARLIANGRQVVVEKYDYRTACKPLEAVYLRALHNK